jgi:hypothetical protein
MEDEIAEIVREHGWFAAAINDHEPPFLYSIGLMQTCDHPELVVFGLESTNAYALLAALIREIRTGQSFGSPGVYALSSGESGRIGIRPVHCSQHPLYLGFAMGFWRQSGRLRRIGGAAGLLARRDGQIPFRCRV